MIDINENLSGDKRDIPVIVLPAWSAFFMLKVNEILNCLLTELKLSD